MLGPLQDTCGTSFLELGAGKAYLACMLAEAFPVQSLVLVDNQSFKLQADRCTDLRNRYCCCGILNTSQFGMRNLCVATDSS